MTVRTTLFGGIGVVIFAFLWVLTGMVSINNNSQDLENQIQAQFGICQTKIDSGYNTIIGQNAISVQGSEQIKGYLQVMFQSSLEDGTQVQSSQNGIIATMAKFTVLGNTDLNELNRVVQESIATAYIDWSNCISRLNDIKLQYANLIGMTPGGLPRQSGKFPNSMFAAWVGVPRLLRSESTTSPRRDLDGDGILTAFDYPSVIVSGFVGDSVANGETPILPFVDTPVP